MTSIRKNIALVAAAAIAVLALGVGVAAAHNTGFNSRVTMHWEDDITNFGGTFVGKVTSAKAGCVPNRVVEVFRVASGDDVHVGSAVTDASGDWAAPAPPEGTDYDGTYYARVMRKDLRPRSAAHDHICRGDRSPDLPVQDQAI